MSWLSAFLGQMIRCWCDQAVVQLGFAHGLEDIGSYRGNRRRVNTEWNASGNPIRPQSRVQFCVMPFIISSRK